MVLAGVLVDTGLLDFIRDLQVTVIWYTQLLNTVREEADLALAMVAIIVAAQLCAVPGFEAVMKERQCKSGIAAQQHLRDGNHRQDT